MTDGRVFEDVAARVEGKALHAGRTIVIELIELDQAFFDGGYVVGGGPCL